MLERYCRQYYQTLCVTPIVKLLIKFTKITPNTITLLAAITGVICGILLSLNLSMLGLIFLLLSGYLDTLDGTLARMTAQASNQGSVFDIVSDRLVEFFIVLGFYLQQPDFLAHGLACMVLLGSFMLCISSFLVVGIFSDKTGEKSFYYSPGLIERAEAFVFFILMILFPSWFNALAWLLIILVSITTIIRMLEFYKQHSMLSENSDKASKKLD